MQFAVESPFLKIGKAQSFAHYQQQYGLQRNKLYVLIVNDDTIVGSLPPNVALVESVPQSTLEDRIQEATAHLIDNNLKLERLSEAHGEMQTVLRQQKINTPSKLLDTLYNKLPSQPRDPVIYSPNTALQALVLAGKAVPKPDDVDLWVVYYSPDVEPVNYTDTIALVSGNDLALLQNGQLSDSRHLVHVALGSKATEETVLMAIADGIDWFALQTDFPTNTTTRSIDDLKKAIRNNLPVA